MDFLSSNVDEPSKRLILQLLEQDAMEDSARNSAKQPAGVLTDGGLAHHGRPDQLHESATNQGETEMALSMTRAVLGEVTQTSAAQEKDRAWADRRLPAFQFAGQQPPPQERLSVHQKALRPVDILFSKETAIQLDEEIESQLETLSNKRRCLTESSKLAVTCQDIAELRPDCVACNEPKPVFDMIQAPCSHWYCRHCITRLVNDALTDQSLFPPRCCRLDIPLDAMRRHIGDELSQRFEEKDTECKDPQRTCCSNAACAEYILPPFVQGHVGTCRACQMQTCTVCKRPAHIERCIDEQDEVLSLAQQAGWQQCPQCHHLIELSTGCNHITCRCRYEFCYVCTMKWKTCHCEVWDENRLIDRARVLAARDVQGPPPQQAVDAAVQSIQEREECRHRTDWVVIDRSNDDDDDYQGYDYEDDDDDFECEVCYDVMGYYILECPICALRACRRCTLNRL
ncbi:hypothetical protein BJY04DRAFT_91091 [Aspergillus karnatakaensis]|uniref:BRcat and Rcat domain-containing protein n=1 Tax=Aspergillus karnatakaensis TaxID=1810916 RepID=UPI003CCDFFD6